MKRSLTLKRPLAVLDLETTGIAVQTDRIVEIAILKIYPNGKRKKFNERVNPGIPIPPEATEVHGINDRHVKNRPSFRKLAKDISTFLEDCDLAGFNLIKFDLPLLENEFNRAKFRFSSEERMVVDACSIFHRKEPRNLVAALKFYCAEEHSKAHSALGDVQACWKVLKAQIRKYGDLPLDLDGLHAFCNERDKRYVDGYRKFEWRHKEATFAFGKHIGRSLQELAKEKPEYLRWMLEKSDFGSEVKAIVSDALMGKFPKRIVDGKRE